MCVRVSCCIGDGRGKGGSVLNLDSRQGQDGPASSVQHL